MCNYGLAAAQPLHYYSGRVQPFDPEKPVTEWMSSICLVHLHPC